MLDVKTPAVHRYTLNSTAVLDQLQRFYAAEKPMLVFLPGGTQIVFEGERDRPGEPDSIKRFEHALVAFDFPQQRSTVLPIDPTTWRLQSPQDIDAAFARQAANGVPPIRCCMSTRSSTDTTHSSRPPDKPSNASSDWNTLYRLR